MNPKKDANETQAKVEVMRVGRLRHAPYLITEQTEQTKKVARSSCHFLRQNFSRHWLISD
jgi:endonuclease IV